MKYYICTDGSTVSGPFSKSVIKTMVESGDIDENCFVCGEESEDWTPLKSLNLEKSGTQKIQNLPNQDDNSKIQAEENHLQALDRLVQCQTQLEINGYRNSEIEMLANDGLEFVNAALDSDSDNPKYLNTKGLLYSDGLGNTTAGLSYINHAYQLAPNDIQIKQNFRNLTGQADKTEPKSEGFSPLKLTASIILTSILVWYIFVHGSSLMDFSVTSSPTKQEWLSDFSQAGQILPGGSIMFNRHRLYDVLGEPDRTQSLGDTVYLYYECSDGMIQIETSQFMLNSSSTVTGRINTY